MSESLFTYLRPEDIRSLNSFEFAPKLFVEGFLAGRHRSNMRGFSTEFQDYRQYSPGDDLNFIDWKVFARSDRYFIRTFEQETDLTCYVFLDSSASMGFGTRLTKLEYSSFFAAGLAYLIVKNRDRVSMCLFDDKLREFQPPGSTDTHLKKILTLLEKNKPGNETSLAEALTKTYPLLKTKGVIVIISDFLDDIPAIFNALNPFLHRGFEIKLFQILDRTERDLPKKGLASFVDMENNSRIVVHTEDLRKRYADMVDGHIRNLRELCARRRIRSTSACTDAHHYDLFERFVAP